eukprot:5783216-Amphidinium_carterae.1
MQPRPNLQLVLALAERRPNSTKKVEKKHKQTDETPAKFPVCRPPQATLAERHDQPGHCHADQAQTRHPMLRRGAPISVSFDPFHVPA